MRLWWVVKMMKVQHVQNRGKCSKQALLSRFRRRHLPALEAFGSEVGGDGEGGEWEG